jgi:hypothetical protein
MRRLTLSWMLSLLLVFAQLGAVLHELGHLSHATHSSGSSLQLDTQAADSNACPSCAGFAQVANPASGSPPSLLVAVAGLHAVPTPVAVIGGADVPAPRSRGPPQV